MRLKFYGLLFAICSLCSPLSAQEVIRNQFLRCSVDWETKIQVGNLDIQSENKLTPAQVKYIKAVYDKTKFNFFKFARVSSCREDVVHVRVFGYALMNSHDCFTNNNLKEDQDYHGRYFSGSRNLYVVPRAFVLEDDFTHEFVHYWQSMCGFAVNEDGIRRYFEYIKESSNG